MDRFVSKPLSRIPSGVARRAKEAPVCFAASSRRNRVSVPVSTLPLWVPSRTMGRMPRR